MDKNSKIYIAGHNGLVGSAIHRALLKMGYNNIIAQDSKVLELTNNQSVDDFFNKNLPEYVFLAASKVGGIHANISMPVDFIQDNLKIQTNIIDGCFKYKVKKLLFLGSSCIYPKNCPQPIKEEYLLTSELEETNKYYALAKIAGIFACQAYNKQYGTNYICVMPTNLYGINDNFHLQNSHVLPAFIDRFHQQKIDQATDIMLWGTGKPKREFLFVDDLVEALILLMNEYNSSNIINIGSGTDITIKDLAEIIKNVTKFKGNLIWDHSKPDGTYQKLLDVIKINSLGWQAKTELNSGIELTYQWFKQNYLKLRR